MLHKVVLPDINRLCLSEAVDWQLRLLQGALTVASVTEAEIETWLIKSEKIASDRAAEIATWLKPRRKGSVGRIGKLKTFREDAPAHTKDKQDWLIVRQREVVALLNGDSINLDALKYDEKAPVWMQAAAEFLERFYDDLESGLPACLFTHSNGKPFTRQIFLDNFFLANSGLCICPVCDTTPLRSLVRGSFYIDVDHFFPKSSYPHLSIHPYNLIPICHVCNSGAKKALDPLAHSHGPRYRTGDIRLPYRSSTSLSEELFISLPASDQSFALRTFALRSGVTSDQTIEAINDILQRVFDIPQRWDRGIGTIGEIMFRRVREHLWFLETEPTAEQAQLYLDELLAMVEQHSSAQEPYSIAMVWWLVYLSNIELSRADSPFLQEIRSWQTDRQHQLQILRQRGKALRNMISEQVSDESRPTRD
jgi:hypothetical protein